MEKTLSMGAFTELDEREVMETEGGSTNRGGGGRSGRRDSKLTISDFIDMFINYNPYGPGGPNPYNSNPTFDPWMR